MAQRLTDLAAEPAQLLPARMQTGSPLAEPFDPPKIDTPRIDWHGTS